MISNFIGRRAALLSVAFFMAVSTFCFGQSTPIAATRAVELLSGGESGILRTHLLSTLKGKAEKINTSERFTAGAAGKQVVFDVVSQSITLRSGNVEQITIKITEAGITKSIDLVQYANDQLGTMQGGNLVTYSLKSREQDCLNQIFGPGSDCQACLAKVTTCRNSSTRITKILSCLLRSIDGSCLRCGIDYYTIYACILLPN